MGAPEDVAMYGLRVSLGNILDNFGFGTVSDDSVDVLSDVMRKFITNIATKSKFYAEHAGRSEGALKDIQLAFKRINFNTKELADFASQNKFVPPKPFPRFPVIKSNPRPLYHPQPSEKELETRPEHIPAFLQAAHPEWTREGADYLAVMKPSTSADKKGAAPDFPSFDGCDAKEMGIRKDDRKPPPPIITRTDDSSATGIRSSANIASQKLYNPDYAAQLSKKKGRPLNGLREGGSRSGTPLGRPNSPFPDSEDKSKIDSPGISKSSEKQKFKPRPPSSAARALFPSNEPSTSTAGQNLEEASSGSPMPRLEQEGESVDSSMNISTDFQESVETPPRIDENLITANIMLFQQLKKQQENEARQKMEKQHEKTEKQRKRDEQKEMKKELAKLKGEAKQQQILAKKLAKEEEKKRKKEEKARLAAEAKAKAKEAQQDEIKRRFDEILKQQMAAAVVVADAPSTEEQKPLRLVITKPMSSNASSAFSPSPVRAPPSVREPSPAPIAVTTNEDEDTVPFYAETGETAENTSFPMNISLSINETPKKDKKKHKKKDKDRDRDRSPSSHKKHKKDKEKKKKKKRDKEEKEKHKEHKHKEVAPVVVEPKPEVEQKPFTLKIRLGDQTPSNSDTSALTYANEPVKLKFKFASDKKDDEKVPPLRLGAMPMPPKPVSVEKVKKKIKSPYDKEKEEKQKRREERKRRDREEAEERQKAEYERLKREHEQKQKKEADDKRKREEEHQRDIREREAVIERDRRREKEREQKAKLDKEMAIINANTDCLFSKKEKEKYKIEKEEVKKVELSPPTPSPPANDDDDGEEEDEKLWICPSCHVAWTEGANMVACDTCNDWFHWHCVGLLVAPPDDIPWFCKKCSRKPPKRPYKSEGDVPKKKKKLEGFYLK